MFTPLLLLLLSIKNKFLHSIFRPGFFFTRLLLSSLRSISSPILQAVFFLPFGIVFLKILSAVLSFVRSFLFHVFPLSTSPYVPFPLLFPALSIPVPLLPSILSRILSWVFFFLSFSLYTPFPRRLPFLSVLVYRPVYRLFQILSQSSSSTRPPPPAMANTGKRQKRGRRGSQKQKVSQPRFVNKHLPRTKQRDGRDTKRSSSEEREREHGGGEAGRGSLELHVAGKRESDDWETDGARAKEPKRARKELRVEEQRRGERREPEDERNGRSPRDEREGDQGRGEAGRGSLELHLTGKREADDRETDGARAKEPKRGRKERRVEEQRRGERRELEDERKGSFPQRAAESAPRPRGLPNLGNTCYMNSVLQCLYHIKPLASRLSQVQGKRSQGEVLRATARLWTTLQKGGAVEQRVRELKHVVGSRDADFQDYRQKEAHDFLSLLLEWLHTDLADDDDDLDDEGDDENGMDRDDRAAQGSNGAESIISKLFRITHLSTIHCGELDVNLTENYEPALNLSLPVARNGPKRLKEVLDKYYRSQMINWDCSYCAREHECESRTVITKLPSVLVLHLSRVSAMETSGQKLRVSYPGAGLVVDGGEDGASRSYRLAAVCCHEGSMEGGHYTAFCRSGEEWFLFNDSFVERVHGREALNRPSAHILFYQAEDALL